MKLLPSLTLQTVLAGNKELSQEEKRKNTAQVRTLEAHHQAITLLSFSADGRWLASADPQSIVIWEVETGEVINILPGHYSPKLQMEIAPTSLSLSSDGRLLASSTWSQGSLTPEKAVIVWDTATGKEIFSLKDNIGCKQVIFGSEGEKLYIACDTSIQVWQIKNRKQIASFDRGQPLESFTLSNDGQIMATADTKITDGQQGKASHKIKLWRLTDNDAKLIGTLEGHKNAIAQLAFTAKDTKLVSSSYDGKIKLWNWKKGQEEKTLTQTSKNGLFSLNANGRLIAGNFPRGTVLNIPRGALLETAIDVPFQGKASAVTFSRDGNTLAWATNFANFPNPTLFLWQIKGKTTLVSSPDNARDNYLSLPLREFWGISSLREAVPFGSDPQQVALAALGLLEKVESETEAVEVTYPQPHKAVVTITQTNLADDSIFGIKYRVEFAPYSSISKDKGDKKWQVIWAGKQYKCWSNRGHQTWFTSLCL